MIDSSFKKEKRYDLINNMDTALWKCKCMWCVHKTRTVLTGERK
ncbi:hypothetical protein BMG_0716 [Priestia megaterium]|nr:hypothetical protein BMG_0716 [Priestia megaterium]